MPVAIACPHCEWKSKVKDELAGKKGKCPTCGELVPIPNKAAAPPSPGSRRDRESVVQGERVDAGIVGVRPRTRVKPKSKVLEGAVGEVVRNDDDRPRAIRPPG